MGVIVQSIPSREGKMSECSFVPSHIRGLFYEFLRRYEEWQSLRRREAGWLAGVVILGSVSLMSFIGITATPEWTTLGFLILFIIILCRYLKVKKDSTHLYINVHILHHHLLGKLEVGFCEHDYPCQCAENFRKYVWKTYRISLYGNPL